MPHVGFDTRGRRPWSRRRKVVAGLVGALVVFGAIGQAFGEDEPVRHTAEASSTTSSTVAPASAPSTAPATDPDPDPTPTEPTSTTTPPPAPTSTAPTSTVPGVLVAVAGVVDGDTIKVRLAGTTERVRVIGIDTPELAGRECFAQQAASRMQSLVQSKQVRLAADPTQADRDRYGRLLRHVRLTDGRSVAELLIAGGFGKEYTYDRPYAGQATYRAAQASAKAAHLGIWSSGCLVAAAPPAIAAPPKPKASTPPAPSSCVIKGNISSSGERIYHVPGQQYYAVTKISLAKGERWFCTEADALAAGWRKSLR